MWVSSAGGLSKYDGYTFVNFTINDGIPDEEVLFVREDSGKRLWIFTMTGKVAWIINDTIYNEDKSGTLKAISKGEIFSCFYEAKDGVIYIGTEGGYVNIIDKANGVKRIKIYDESRLPLVNPPYKFWETDNQVYCLAKYNCIFKYGNNNFQKIHNSSWKIAYPWSVFKYKNYYVFPEAISNDLLILKSDWSATIQCGLREKLSKKVFRIIAAKQFNDSSFIIGTTEGGFLIRGDILKNKISEVQKLTNEQVSCIFINDENNVWLGTTDKGLLYFNSNSFNTKYFNARNGLASDEVTSVFSLSRDTLYLGHKNSLVTELIKNKPERTFRSGTETTTISNAIRRGDQIWFGTNFGIHITRKGKMVDIIKTGAIKDMLVDRDGKIWVATFRSLLRLDTIVYSRTDEWFYHTYKPIINERVNAIGSLPGGELLIGQHKGFSIWRNGKLNRYYTNSSVLSKSILDISTTETGKIWLCGGFGIVGLRLNNKGILVIETISNEKSIKKIIPLNDTLLLASTRSSILKYAVRKNKLEILIEYPSTQGIPLGEINDFSYDDGQITIAHSSGLIRFYEDQITNKIIPPKFHITKLFVNSIVKRKEDFLNLQHFENSLSFEYGAISHANSDNIIYKYKLNKNDAWSYTKSRVVVFPSLSPGDYSLKIAAGVNNKEWSPVEEIRFKINAPFWKRTQFILAAILILVTGGYFIAQVIWKGKRDKLLIRNKILELENKAFHSQMNPHFVFNCLNSIQSLFNNDNHLIANVYLSRFGELLRMILEHSSRQYITLTEEIELLENYLALESMRYDDSFTYSISCSDEELQDEIVLPAMLIQTFVENSIKHGRIFERSNGKITVEFNRKDDLLFCSITDNGFGRPVKRDSDRSPLGMKMIQQRLIALYGENDSSMDIIDLKETNGEASGTQIVIKIPYKCK